jgi:sec-independent protein translocase protein TatB
MMALMSFSETIFLFFLALVIFGPKKLPEIARQVGKFMNEFRRASNEFKAQIEQEIAQLEVEKKPTILPPHPIEGTTSRSVAGYGDTLPGETMPVSPDATEATATLAAAEPAPPTSEASPEPPPVATEAVHPADDVTSPRSQESHA